MRRREKKKLSLRSTESSKSLRDAEMQQSEVDSEKLRRKSTAGLEETEKTT